MDGNLAVIRTVGRWNALLNRRRDHFNTFAATGEFIRLCCPLGGMRNWLTNSSKGN